MNSNRKHDFNQEFFDIIDTEEKAYILGFICAIDNSPVLG